MKNGIGRLLKLPEDAKSTREKTEKLTTKAPRNANGILDTSSVLLGAVVHPSRAPVERV
jgi:hypothetical protein